MINGKLSKGLFLAIFNHRFLSVLLLVLTLVIVAVPLKKAEAALVITDATNAESTAVGTTYTTASISPAPGSIIFIIWSFRSTDLADVSGETMQVGNAGTLNGTWTLLSTKRQIGTSVLVSVFKGTSASWGTGGMVLSTVAGRSMNRGQWAAVQVTGQNTATPVVQIVGANGSSGTLAPVLASFASANNATLLLAASTGVDDSTYTPEAGWTRLSSTGTLNRYSAYSGVNDTSPTVTYSPAGNNVAGYGLEIGASVAAGGSTVTLSGQAWSDVPQSTGPADPIRGAGWIQFKGQAQNGANYGVTVNTTSGNMAGQAWSENYGWLSFDNDASGTLGCPTAPCQANVNLTTGVLTGWARFTAAPTGTSGVWNGWLELKGTATNGNPFGVTYNSSTREFSGEAWGGSDIGWVRFKSNAINGNPYVVKADADIIPQTATINVTVNPASPASGSWSIAPGAVTGTGTGTRIVNPASGGTSYTITPGAAPFGYDAIPTITSTPTDTGSSFLLSPNETKGFVITYNLTPPSFDYSLNNPANVTVRKAGIPQSGQNTITATWISGTGSVTLSASGLPAGVSAGFSGQGCAPSSGSPCNFTVTYTVQNGAVPAPGDYTITINATSPAHSKTFNLHIDQALGLLVTCSASPTLAKVGDNVTWSVSIDNPAAGPPYTYAWSGSSIPAAYATPDPTRNSFVIQYTTTGVKNAIATVADALNNQAQCPQAFINIGVNPGFGEF